MIEIEPRVRVRVRVRLTLTLGGNMIEIEPEWWRHGIRGEASGGWCTIVLLLVPL